MTIRTESPDVLAALADLPKFGCGVGLHRMLWLRDALDADAWLAGIDAVKVTGSNGKGSVCAMLSSIFEQLDVSHGLYTSPHLRDFRERIRIDAAMISAAELARSLRWTRDRLATYAETFPGDRPSAFEAFTILALHHFARHRCETIVAEAGLGGRFDSTRVIPGTIAALTSVDLEHTEVLGETPELIAYDKADLCGEGGRLIVGRVDDDLLRRLKAYARLRGVTITAVAERCRLLATRYASRRMIVDAEIDGHRFEQLEIALPGRHQFWNAAVAVLLARAWLRRHRPALGDEALRTGVREGLRRVRWPGRFQRVAADPDVFVDVGHTPQAAAAVVRTVRDVLADERILLVTGASHDKNAEAIVGELLEAADSVICTRAWHKGAPVERIEEIVASSRPELARRVAANVEEAIETARGEARSGGMTVVVAGGLFLAVEAAEVLAGRDPRALRFF